MELQQSTNVYTSDGKEAGSLNRVVIEPETNKVTHIIIKSGLIIKETRNPVSNVICRP
jgi:sporulation protein YlmC with PRC-barrel domain